MHISSSDRTFIGLQSLLSIQLSALQIKLQACNNPATSEQLESIQKLTDSISSEIFNFKNLKKISELKRIFYSNGLLERELNKTKHFPIFMHLVLTSALETLDAIKPADLFAMQEKDLQEKIHALQTRISIIFKNSHEQKSKSATLKGHLLKFLKIDSEPTQTESASKIFKAMDLATPTPTPNTSSKPSTGADVELDITKTRDRSFSPSQVTSSTMIASSQSMNENLLSSSGNFKSPPPPRPPRSVTPFSPSEITTTTTSTTTISSEQTEPLAPATTNSSSPAIKKRSSPEAHSKPTIKNQELFNAYKLPHLVPLEKNIKTLFFTDQRYQTVSSAMKNSSDVEALKNACNELQTEIFERVENDLIELSNNETKPENLDRMLALSYLYHAYEISLDFYDMTNPKFENKFSRELRASFNYFQAFSTYLKEMEAIPLESFTRAGELMRRKEMKVAYEFYRSTHRVVTQLKFEKMHDSKYKLMGYGIRPFITVQLIDNSFIEQPTPLWLEKWLPVKK